MQNRRRRNIADMTVAEQVEKIKTEICDEYCKYPLKAKSTDELDDICRRCPLNRL